MYLWVSWVRKKSSVYVDVGLWRRFRKRAMEKGVELSTMLEDVIHEELLDYLSEALDELAGSHVYDLDFKPVKPREGAVSELVRVMRSERSDSVSGQQRDS